MAEAKIRESCAESKLDQLLAAYLQADSSDESLNNEEVVAANPEVADELVEAMDDVNWLRRLTGGNSRAAESTEAKNIAHDLSATRGLASPNVSIDANGTANFESFGDFELLEEIGRGGMGVVYKARQKSLNRIVALKMILTGHLATKDDVKRFLAEAEAAASMDHNGIVPVHSAGMHEGHHYFTMSYIEGLGLDALIQQGSTPPSQEVAVLVCRIADAIHYAHQNGVTHRDLKPANILLAYGESSDAITLTTPDGPLRCEPKVADFGLAKKNDSDAQLTGTGQVVGTPSYMPPEQAAGRTSQIDARSDIYSLGAVLYCLLAGGPPFRSNNVVDTLNQVLNDEPIPPRQLNRSVPVDLATICLKSLSKTPERRYQTSKEFADDIRRWIRGEPITARPVGSLERASKWAKRYPVKVSLILVSLVAVFAIVVGGVSLWAGAETKRQHERAESALYFNRILRIDREFHDHNLGVARKLLAECPEKRRSWEWNLLDRMCYPDAKLLHGHHGEILSVDFNNNGDQVITAGADSTVRRWDAESGRQLEQFSSLLFNRVTSVSFSPDNSLLAAVDEKGYVAVWRAFSTTDQHSVPRDDKFHPNPGGPMLELELPRSASSGTQLTFSPSGEFIALALGPDSQESGLMLLNVTNGETHQVLDSAKDRYQSVCFSPDGRLIAAGGCTSDPGAPANISIWNRTTGSEIGRLSAHTGTIFSLKFSPDGRYLVSGAGDGRIVLWDFAERLALWSIQAHSNAVRGVAFHPEGHQLACCSEDGSISIWQTATGTQLNVLRGHTAAVADVEFSVNGVLASAGIDGTTLLWDPLSPQDGQRLGNPDVPLTGFGFSPARPQDLATSDENGALRFWDLSSGESTGLLALHHQPIRNLTFGPKGDRFAYSCGADSLSDSEEGVTVFIRRIADGEVVAHFLGGPTVVNGLSFSADGKRLVCAGGERETRGDAIVWEIDTKRRLFSIGRPRGVFQALLSPDGSMIACTIPFHGEVILWDPQTRKPLHHIYHNNAELTNLSAAFSPDGTLLATGGSDRVARIWDLSDPESPVCELSGHRLDIRKVVFSRDGTRLATSSDDGTVKLWDVSTGQETLTLRPNIGPITDVGFSFDSNRIAALGTRSPNLMTWNATPRDPVNANGQGNLQ